MKFAKLQIAFLLLLFLTFHTSAQNKIACKVRQIEFSCPNNLQIEKDNSKNLFVGFDSKHKICVFAFSPEKEIQSENLINKTLEKAFSSIYSTDYKKYKIKDSKDFWGDSSWSQYEVNKFAKVGFNKEQNHTLHFQYVQLSFNKKQVIVGFIYERFTGETAEEKFDKWSGGGNGGASFNLQQLIINITGEKRPMLTPGGPPPPAGSPPPAGK
jgi:hypothetical protein